MARWCQVREDLMFIFEKVMESDLGDPIRQTIRDFVSRVRGGMPPDRALQMMTASLPHEQFADLVTAVRFNFGYRGNLSALLEQMEVHLHRMEEEYDRRRLSNLRDRRLTMMILAAVPIIFPLRVLSNPVSQAAFLETPLGPAVLGVCFIVYAAAIVSYNLIRRRING